MPSPMPDAAPVTKAVFPDKSIIGVSPGSVRRPAETFYPQVLHQMKAHWPPGRGKPRASPLGQSRSRLKARTATPLSDDDVDQNATAAEIASLTNQIQMAYELTARIQ